MIHLTENEVRKETIELLEGKRIVTAQELEQRYNEWDANQFNDPGELYWELYFAASNNRRAYLQRREDD